MAREDAWEMPQGPFSKMTYEYLCAECNHAWEEEQSISAPATETCPSCGQRSAKRQVSGGVGFILKGGGWYADGYGSGSAKKSDDAPAVDGKKSADAKSAGSGSETAKDTSTKNESSSSDSKSGDPAKGDSGKGGGASGDSAASPPA
jgi:putative FmdB family regulatory protein